LDIATRERVVRPDRSAPARANVWSTDPIGERERSAYWREVICKNVFNISVEAPPGAFSARITARASGPLRFAMVESSAYEFIRTRKDIEAGPADHYSICLQLAGTIVLHQCGESFALHPHEISISDGLQPFTTRFFDGGRRAVAVIPREMVDRRAPWLRRSPLHKLAAASPYVDLAARHILALASDKAVASDQATGLLTENLCNLLALASATDIEPARLQPELQIEALLAFCRHNLHDPDLSPQRVADHFGMSVRTLHLRFKQIGQTFGHWVLTKRLEACAKALRDPDQRVLNISDIAYRWGFNDLSYFNKAFRARFNRTPREWRHELDI